MTAQIKFYSKQAIAANILNKKGEGFEIIEIDGKWAVVDQEQLAELTKPAEEPEQPQQEDGGDQTSTDGEQLPEGTVPETGDDQGGDDAEGEQEPEIDMGVNPVGLDRSTTTMKTEKFGRTRYVVQEEQSDGSRKFIPAAGDQLVAWKFHALQFDTAEQAVGYISGEAGLSVVPFRKAWLETFHPISAPKAPEVEVPEGYETNEGEIGKWIQTYDGPVWVKLEQEGEAA